MGGYQMSYESFETYVRKQAIMAKNEYEKAKEKHDDFYGALAEGREHAVFELAKYLGAPEKEVKKIWEEA
jgi:adenylosuccinate lyase